jgi:aryl-alcohol dehydrogenase-like predicted oxidoreductase
MIKEILPGEIPMAQLALRWILDHEAVSTVIPGASSPVQTKANTGSSELPKLTEDLHMKLRDLYKKEIRTHIRGPY